jgi:hypothetical protein
MEPVEEGANGLGGQRFGLARHPITSEIQMTGPFENCQPLASLRHVREGLGARFPRSATQFIVSGSREEQDRFGNPRPRVVGKDQTCALRRKCDVGTEGIGPWSTGAKLRCP